MIYMNVDIHKEKYEAYKESKLILVNKDKIFFQAQHG
jgi:hypothetical protein